MNHKYTGERINFAPFDSRQAKGSRGTEIGRGGKRSESNSATPTHDLVCTYGFMCAHGLHDANRKVAQMPKLLCRDDMQMIVMNSLYKFTYSQIWLWNEQKHVQKFWQLLLILCDYLYLNIRFLLRYLKNTEKMKAAKSFCSKR